MDINEKLELNKLIRTYKGDNTFVLSLQKQLKTSKYLQKVTVGNKDVKVLSDKQYEAAKSAMA
jgi:hypothetical protein